MVCAGEVPILVLRHDVGAGSNQRIPAVKLDVNTVDVGRINEELLLVGTQHVVIPVADGVVELIGDVAEHQLVVRAEFLPRNAREVGVAVGLHVEQRHLAV